MEMVQLGTYLTSTGERYHGVFFPEGKFAQAMGPIPAAGKGPTVAVKAKVIDVANADDAKDKLAERLPAGHWE